MLKIISKTLSKLSTHIINGAMFAKAEIVDGISEGYRSTRMEKCYLCDRKFPASEAHKIHGRKIYILCNGCHGGGVHAYLASDFPAEEQKPFVDSLLGNIREKNKENKNNKYAD